MTRYFKVVHGYSAEDFIPIDETELEKAIYAHVTERKVVLRNGSVNGSQILKVVPDWHRAMGWNRGHRLQAEDWEDIENRIGQRSYEGLIAAAKDSVQRHIALGTVDQIGKLPLQVPEPARREGLKAIGELLR